MVPSETIEDMMDSLKIRVSAGNLIRLVECLRARCPGEYPSSVCELTLSDLLAYSNPSVPIPLQTSDPLSTSSALLPESSCASA
jgi:hypothetical protein